MLFNPFTTAATTIVLPCLCGQGTIIAPLTCPAHGPQPAPPSRIWCSTSANAQTPPPYWVA